MQGRPLSTYIAAEVRLLHLCTKPRAMASSPWPPSFSSC
uniref:Uncharacterized protein n=1 Tax=Arundo donax TaxID=35708 RepID=A0A0A9BYV0_ARUDO